jgi:hypothetical protein
MCAWMTPNNFGGARSVKKGTLTLNKLDRLQY